VFRLPESVLWFEPPLAANWDPVNNYWSTEEIHDLKFNEDKQVKHSWTLTNKIVLYDNVRTYTRRRTPPRPPRIVHTYYSSEYFFYRRWHFEAAEWDWYHWWLIGMWFKIHPKGSPKQPTPLVASWDDEDDYTSSNSQLLLLHKHKFAGKVKRLARSWVFYGAWFNNITKYESKNNSHVPYYMFKVVTNIVCHKSQRPVVCLNRYSNLPYQSWDLRPDLKGAAGGVVLTITAAVLILEFLIKVRKYLYTCNQGIHTNYKNLRMSKVTIATRSRDSAQPIRIASFIRKFFGCLKFLKFVWSPLIMEFILCLRM